MSKPDALYTQNYIIQKAIRLTGVQTISRLKDFYNKASLLENDYKNDALQLIHSVLQLNQSGDTKKELTQLLLGLGFKKSNVSKMIEATRFTLQLERDKSDATDWVKSLPISTAYVLASCEDDAFNRIWTKDAEWGDKPLTYKQATDLKLTYERHAERVRARPRAADELPLAHQKNLPQQKFLRGNSSKSPQAATNLQKARKLLADYPELVKQIDNLISETE